MKALFFLTEKQDNSLVAVYLSWQLLPYNLWLDFFSSYLCLKSCLG